ncbi:MAG: hypothetical protein NTW87_08140 [Planctomycetota bacterium]|nr:hypothetical protein [Planctomycetota bacterium]
MIAKCCSSADAHAVKEFVHHAIAGGIPDDAALRVLDVAEGEVQQRVREDERPFGDGAPRVVRIGEDIAAGRDGGEHARDLWLVLNDGQSGAQHERADEHVLAQPLPGALDALAGDAKRLLVERWGTFGHDSDSTSAGPKPRCARADCYAGDTDCWTTPRALQAVVTVRHR